ncbi:Endo-1,4-beta-xylanase, GH35 family [Rathayibacter oskolensis]|uniref:Beta-xylanase n=1 Tax=Rathayibacter oskolensis TaxID=1891671 RepID=A0A1X7NM86_9MICO|nr:endo-1,4-beta-xylanase [Rathayibacter oskolensis]SMH38299.1 Endo-1,4-beta-xylanase, GH35 family [Rathayibacter oskolensis]
MPDLCHRTLTTDVLVVDDQGRPVPDVAVTTTQLAHAFGFGNIGFDFVDWLGGPPLATGGDASQFFGGRLSSDPRMLADAWLEVFNTVTLPFYWRGFEPERGRPETARLKKTAEWFAERGVRVKGHPLVWHTLAPEWLLPLDDAEVEEVLRARIRREVADFAGIVDQWDAINETVIMPRFTAEANAITGLATRLGRVGMVALAFEEARSVGTAGRFVLNDFDLSSDYEHLIEDCLDAGIPIDAIGLQTHMHQGYRGEDRISEVLERFSRFGLPLQMTETTLLSGDLMPKEIEDLNDYQVESWPSTEDGEARQADELVRHYRNVLAHPAVESLTYWGLTDDGAWLGAPSGLLRRDGSRKPGYDALHDLIRRQWWHDGTTARTGADGRVPLQGFAGRYRIAAGGASSEVELAAGSGPITVVVER